MLPFYELMMLNYAIILISALTGGLILIMYGFPQMMASDDIHTFIPLDISPKMNPEFYRKVKRKDLISRLGLSMVIGAIIILRNKSSDTLPEIQGGTVARN